MTLRVKLEIIPHGDETNIREIGRLDIHNLGEGADGHCIYNVNGHGMVRHLRSDGAWWLVQKAIQDLGINGPHDSYDRGQLAEPSEVTVRKMRSEWPDRQR